MQRLCRKHPAKTNRALQSLATYKICLISHAQNLPPFRDAERWPAGDFTVQSTGGEGLPAWTEEDRSVEDEDVVLWHSFGLLHVPRVEDFPVMPCESTGFTLKPDGFFAGNPTIDLAPSSSAGGGKSKCCSHVD